MSKSVICIFSTDLSTVKIAFSTEKKTINKSFMDKTSSLSTLSTKILTDLLHLLRKDCGYCS
ncbi:hypothetical protein J5TS2_44220 [Brevibacillus halotolerans]|nr:hypothetical protein J5TS2_44220 [Brevibacillus halotolerans]